MGSIRAEVGVGSKLSGHPDAMVGDDDVVYLGPFAIAPDFQVGTAPTEIKINDRISLETATLLVRFRFVVL